MRHRKSGRQLNRNSSHRQAMFRNMAGSLVRHEIIKTTLPKAKELRRVVEPLITLAKADSVANRRLAFARTRDNEIVAKLFNELVDLEEEKARLNAEKEKLEAEVERSNKILSNKGFVAKAPEEKIKEEKEKLEKYTNMLEDVKSRLAKI